MHEQTIAQEIIREALKHQPVKGITVEVGEVAHLPADEMKEVLEKMVPEWEIKIEEKEAKISCECGYEGRPEILEKGHDSTIFKCPKCGAMMPKVLEGDKIILREIKR